MNSVTLQNSLKREDNAVPCECGGYADRVGCSPAEIKTQNCSRNYECCARAFVCRICETRLIGKAAAPDLAW